MNDEHTDQFAAAYPQVEAEIEPRDSAYTQWRDVVSYEPDEKAWLEQYWRWTERAFNAGWAAQSKQGADLNVAFLEWKASIEPGTDDAQFLAKFWHWTQAAFNGGWMARQSYHRGPDAP